MTQWSRIFAFALHFTQLTDGSRTGGRKFVTKSGSKSSWTNISPGTTKTKPAQAQWRVKQIVAQLEERLGDKKDDGQSHAKPLQKQVSLPILSARGAIKQGDSSCSPETSATSAGTCSEPCPSTIQCDKPASFPGAERCCDLGSPTGGRERWADAQESDEDGAPQLNFGLSPSSEPQPSTVVCDQSVQGGNLGRSKRKHQRQKVYYVRLKSSTSDMNYKNAAACK